MTETSNYEQVVMTPKCKTANSTVLLIERKINSHYVGNGKVHVAGGDHTGIVINKEISAENGEILPAKLSLEFRVFLVSGQTGKHTQESRILRYWFKTGDNKSLLNDTEQATIAQEFFKELVSPQEFPRDYVGFIKKIMKLMQHKYESINKLEVELRQLEEIIVPTRPLSADENSFENAALLSQEKVLELIESAYPNPVTINEMTQNHSWNKDEVTHHMQELEKRGLVKAMEHGAYTRQQSIDNRVTIVKQMPTISSAKQPTIAVITAQYCEKLAVDAMIENKTTYVRYTTVGTCSSPGEAPKPKFGESNVYTLGNIGAHRVVSTKLPSIGHTREAMTAAGNTTTRLLGTFQKVDYVFLVGVGGGVPHYTDYNKHVRLGDVVVSSAGTMKDVYLYCDKVKKDEKGYSFEVKPYSPANLKLQEIASHLKLSTEEDLKVVPPWVNYLQEGLELLKKQPEALFEQPSSTTDKLYMSIGAGDLIEVTHPTPQNTSSKRLEGQPKVHFSPVASGRQVVRDDQTRQLFAGRFGVLAFDCEFDSVIESILGNCKDSFVCIRGISDYKDGTRRKEWQPYASLVAASFMKAIICSMEPPTNV